MQTLELQKLTPTCLHYTLPTLKARRRLSMQTLELQKLTPTCLHYTLPTLRLTQSIALLSLDLQWQLQSTLSLTHSLTHIPFLPCSLPLSTYTRSHLNRVDSQWQKRATDTALSAASKVTEQLNYFLVAHLKSVPLDKLSNKISQTFAAIDLDGSGEINTYEV